MDPSLSAIRAVLAATPARWHILVETLPAEILSRPPQPGEWSALDCLRHMIETEKSLYPVRVQQFLDEAPFDDFDPDEAAAQSEVEPLGVLMAKFAQMRTASLMLLDRLTADDLVRTNRHPKLGQVTLIQMLNTWAGHDLMHTVQAERSLMQPFIADCGPWRGFFKDHAV